MKWQYVFQFHVRFFKRTKKQKVHFGRRRWQPMNPKNAKKRAIGSKIQSFSDKLIIRSNLKTGPHLQSKNCQVIQHESFKIFEKRLLNPSQKGHKELPVAGYINVSLTFLHPTPSEPRSNICWFFPLVSEEIQGEILRQGNLLDAFRLVGGRWFWAVFSLFWMDQSVAFR